MGKKKESEQPPSWNDIVSLDFSEEMKTSYRNYAMSVIIDRALPDVRDGLKPVQRRILFAMYELGLDPKKPHRKSARIVGDTMGKYHPHGDSSIYDALVHMSEDYSLSIPLVDGHGNFGSIDGDPAAAMRYTEARLSEGAMTMLKTLKQRLVPFVPNFDNNEEEPTVLPATLPNLLINGTTGIAVGMATNIPPHNPGEVIDGVIAYLNNPDISTEELMRYIPGPDFPTGGIIVNSDAMAEIYETGEGRLRIRAKTEIEAGDAGRKNIVVTEIPYTVAGNKTKLVENLVVVMKDKVFDEIYDVRDESSKEGIRIVIEVKKERDPENLLNGLYKKTALEDTYSVNLLAVKAQQPITFTLKRLIAEFVMFQEELTRKEYEHAREEAEKRLEIVAGLLRATDLIDLIIEIIRGCSSKKQAKNCLAHGEISGINFKSEASRVAAEALSFTERQADAILAMQLGSLIGLEVLSLHEENDKLLDTIADCTRVLGSDRELRKVIQAKLKDYRKQFAYPRRTEITALTASDYVEEVRVEELTVLIDRFGYVKCLDSAAFARTADETAKDFSHIVPIKSSDRLCLFTAQGNFYQVKVSALPRCRVKDKGVLIQNLCKVGKEDVLLYLSFEALYESQLMFVTRAGYIKLVSGAEFETNRLAITATKLEGSDLLVGVTPLSATQILSGDQKVILLTALGLSLGFSLSEVSELKKTSRGIKAISLDSKDAVVFASAIAPEQENFTYDGKLLSAKKIRLKKRGGKGQKTTL